MNPTNGSWWIVHPNLALNRLYPYSAVMYLTSYTSLTWAYQLHYYICFRTHRRRESLTADIVEMLNDICTRHDYRLLESRPECNQVLCLLSLRPAHAISKVVQTLKCNASREVTLPVPVWARGYLARSVGRMRIDAVREYLDHQAEHHGYTARVLSPVHCYRATEKAELTAPHCSFELNHHLVFATRRRKSVFDSSLGRAVCEYWLRVAVTRGFAIDQLSVLPDHVHLIVRIAPGMSIEDCALLLMNNGQYFVSKNYGEVLVKLGMDQLWESSAYAGTCGDFTTALVRTWLRKNE
ncbi:MAG TPA: IS200/IS605 family transposase [Pyrinomonadaceae bacterium]|nr:IS200/IS605 family transposase [Pyrinomonadaceae bacterium]